MSDEYDDASNEGGEGIKNLRKQYDTLKKQNDELLGELTQFRTQQRKQTVAGILKAKGLPEKAATLYSGEDASEEAVGKWIEEYGDVFGLKQQQQQQDAQQQEIQRFQNAAFNAPPAEVGNIAPGNGALVGDPNELLQQMKTLPYDKLVELGLLPNVSGSLYDSHGR